jgi:hypothetical protein
VYQQQQQQEQQEEQDAENPFLDPPFSRIKIVFASVNPVFQTLTINDGIMIPSQSNGCCCYDVRYCIIRNGMYNCYCCAL